MGSDTDGAELSGNATDTASGQPRRRGRPPAATVVTADPDFQLPDLMVTELVRVLERGIVSGEYAPGTRFVEEEVAATFKVSRSPVREAFHRLAADGLVLREARRGVRVTPISLTDLDEVYSCRLELEGFAAEQAAEVGPQSRDMLETAFEELRQARFSGDLNRYFDTNIEFTARIQELARNKTLIRLLQGLTKQALRYRFFAYRRYPDLMDFSLQTNRDLIDAIERGYGSIAREVARLLVRHSWSKIREALE